MTSHFVLILRFLHHRSNNDNEINLKRNDHEPMIVDRCQVLELKKKLPQNFYDSGSLQIATGLAGKGNRGNIGKNFSRLPTIGRGTQLDSLGVNSTNVGNNQEPDRMHAHGVKAANVRNNQGTHSANRMHDPFDEAANDSKYKHVPIDDQNANPNIIANDVHNSEKITLFKRKVPATVLAFSEISQVFKPDSSNEAGTCSRRRQRPLDAPNSTPTGTQSPLSGRGPQPPTGTQSPLSRRGPQPPTGTQSPLSGRAPQPPTGTQSPLSGRGPQPPTGTQSPLSGRGPQPPTGTQSPLSGRGPQPTTGYSLHSLCF
ncbi:hypothetical protein ACFE04_007798 [Oxalis oulophora]